MDIEELNKHQVVLLTLLVSFVTSIATGIVTVALLGQAPPSFTRTINNVIEKTVEKVVPGTSSVVEKTISVNEEDVVTGAILKGKNSVVAIRLLSDNVPTFVGWGVVLDDQGTIATDSHLISADSLYSIETDDKKTFNANLLYQSENRVIAFLKAAKSEADKNYKFTPAIFSDSQVLKMGQTAIAFSGNGKKYISVGVVSSLNESNVTNVQTSSTSTENVIPKVIGVNVSGFTPSSVTGGMLADSLGNIIGLSVYGTNGISYVASNVLKEEFSKFVKN